MKNLCNIDNVNAVQVTGFGKYLISARLSRSDNKTFAIDKLRLNITESSNDCLILLTNLNNLVSIRISNIDNIKQIECILYYKNNVIEIRKTESNLAKCSYECLLDISRLIGEIDDGIHH